MPPTDPKHDPNAEPMLQFFKYEHLKSLALQAVSMPFCQLAEWMVTTLPRNPERTVGLRKLLEAKDCAVRAALYNVPGAPELAANETEKPLG